MNLLLGHQSGILIAAGAAFTSWRMAPFGMDAVDHRVLLFLTGFFTALAVLWLASPVSPWITNVALAMFGLSIVFILSGGVPGLRIVLPGGVQEGIIKEQVLLWIAITAAVITWQKLWP